MAPFLYVQRSVFIAAAAAIVMLSSSPCYAVTGGELTSKMSKDMEKGYIGGLVDMLSYETVLQNDRPRAQCIYDSFYKKDGVPERVAKAMVDYADKDASIVLIAVMKQLCPEKQ